MVTLRSLPRFIKENFNAVAIRLQMVESHWRIDITLYETTGYMKTVRQDIHNPLGKYLCHLPKDQVAELVVRALGRYTSTPFNKSDIASIDLILLPCNDEAILVLVLFGIAWPTSPLVERAMSDLSIGTTEDSELELLEVLTQIISVIWCLAEQ